MAEIITRAHKFQGQLTARDRLHVTLFQLSGLPEPFVQGACEAIDEARVAPFDVSFDRTMSFRGRPGNRPFVLTGVEGLRRLKSFRRSLAAALMEKGRVFPARRDFAPHVTLLFDDRAVEENPFGPIGWTVRDDVLIRSLRGHRHLARWTLQA
jgi:RNA 2',3'-cyclic 3'-phosphodiesterase